MTEMDFEEPEDLEEAKQQITKLQSSHEELVEKLDDLDEELEDREETIENLKEDKEELEEEIDSLKETVEEKDGEIEEKEDRIDQLEESYNNLLEDLKEHLANEVANAMAELDSIDEDEVEEKADELKEEDLTSLTARHETLSDIKTPTRSEPSKVEESDNPVDEELEESPNNEIDEDDDELPAGHPRKGVQSLKTFGEE